MGGMGDGRASGRVLGARDSLSLGMANLSGGGACRGGFEDRADRSSLDCFILIDVGVETARFNEEGRATVAGDANCVLMSDIRSGSPAMLLGPEGAGATGLLLWSLLSPSSETVFGAGNDVELVADAPSIGDGASGTILTGNESGEDVNSCICAGDNLSTFSFSPSWFVERPALLARLLGSSFNTP